MEFSSLAELGFELAESAIAVPLALHAGVEQCANLVEKTAKAEIGHYQPATGQFPEWAELAESTKDDRVSRGFSENDPLLRTGGLRDSISHQSSALEAVIGSDSDNMVYQEFGTKAIPPRPVLGPAAFRNKEKIQAILGAATLSGIINLRGSIEAIHPSLGYDIGVE